MSNNDIIKELKAKLGSSPEENVSILRREGEKFAKESNINGIKAVGQLLLDIMSDSNVMSSVDYMFSKFNGNGQQTISSHSVKPAINQVMSIPQFAGYSQNGQPLYTYTKMQVVGYDNENRPMLAPLVTAPPVMANSRGFINITATPAKLTVGQKIAAAAAAKGSPATANISKIATNPHGKNTASAFTDAISKAKQHANESLTDTQGLQAENPVINSVEDVLSTLGDNSAIEKKRLEEALNRSIPDFQEFKAPPKQRQVQRPRVTPVKQPPRALTAKELREKKKQEKIDARFRKDMERRKG